jgi:hypothetical protein
MNRHADLPDAGLHSHFDIDQQLPEPHEKDALVGTLNTPSADNEYVTADDLAQHVEPLQGYEDISGFLHWEYDGIDGTARTVIADGPGDVAYRLTILHATRASDGATNGGVLSTAPGGSQYLYSNAGEDCKILVSAGGAVTVQRTAGTLTYKVTLWLLWI